MREHVRYLFKWLMLAVLAAMASALVFAQTHPNGSATRASGTRLDALVRQLVEQSGAPGVQAVVVKDGKIVWSGSYGDAVLDVPGPRRSMRDDSIIQIASTSKIVVAIAVMQQVEKGKLSLDDDINKYVSFPVRNPRWPDVPITWRMLLTHTSSIESDVDQAISDSLFVYGKDDPTTLEDYVKDRFEVNGRYYGPNLFRTGKPGSERIYSNDGIALAAFALEDIVHESFATYVQEEILTPLKMHDTSYFLANFSADRLSVGYVTEKKSDGTFSHFLQRTFLEHVPPSGTVRDNQISYAQYPIGRIYTTATDLARLMMMFQNRGTLYGARILSPSSVDLMGSSAGYRNLDGWVQGLGLLGPEDLRGRQLWGHDGDDHSYSSAFFFNPETHIGAIVLANTNYPDYSLSYALLDLDLHLMSWFEGSGQQKGTPKESGSGTDKREFPGPARERDSSPADEAVSPKVDEIVRAQMHEQNIPGVSLAVLRDGKVIKAAGYGLASIELKVPVAPGMLFHSGSIAKAFTATAVMMLVEEGKIGLDDKVSKYLPEAPPSWNEVTIRRLLTHTSGIRDFFGEDGDPQYDFHQNLTEDEMVRKFAAQTMRFPPGEKWSYCNAGYVILGVVIHRVTGKFWFDFEKERIFDPLGMTSTRLIGTEDIIPNRVNGYSLVNGKLKNEPWVAPSWYSTADGCLYTNVFDMAKWDAALYTEKLIKHSTLEQMWTPIKLNDGTSYPYGFAWRIRQVNGHRIIQHDGVDTSFTTRIARYVNDRLSIIVFLNLGEDEEALMPTRMTDSVAAIYIPSLGDSKSQTSASDASKSTPSVPRARPLSPQQAEVWKGEENLQMYEQQKDLKRYLSIWDEHFVGWPDYDQRPAYKPEFEASAAEEFRELRTTSPPLPPPRPEAVGLFGDVAVTHYFLPEADQSSPTVFRITHTWQKGPAGWHIVGGMSCEVPRTPVIAGSVSF